MNYLQRYLLGKNDRCAEIAFSDQQNAKNLHYETLEK
jgi:hypothetical protein